MSTLTTHTTANRDAHSVGLCKFNTTSNTIEVSDGTTWVIYDYDSTVVPFISSTFAVSYDGTDDYHQLDLDGTSTGGILAANNTDIELTLSAWIYPQTTSTKSFMSWAPTSVSNSPYMYLQHNRIYLYGNRNFSTNMTQNAWNHVMITRTASTDEWKVFLNGNSTPVVTYDDGGSLGARSSATKMFFGSGLGGLGVCKIDEVAFWNSDKSGDLANIYGSGTPGSGTPTDLTNLSPYGWWRMGENDSAVDGTAAGTISTSLSGSSSNDMTVGGGSPTYTNQSAP